MFVRRQLGPLLRRLKSHNCDSQNDRIRRAGAGQPLVYRLQQPSPEFNVLMGIEEV